MAINPIDKCVGCNGPTNGYEYIGIGNPEDFPAHTAGAAAAVPGVTGVWEAFPICRRCHHEPPRPLKLHYVHRSQVAHALRLAGSSTLGDPIPSSE
jgi:hypothetical protein